ncbi:MAG: DUF2478 domain-containing protein [Rhizobiales bacterium]|nr:DUF2478 domain-containing protein [Hyphomicrobiales bacterium]
MFARHIVPAPDLNQDTVATVGAVIYPDEEFPEALFDAIVAAHRGRGLALAGVVQRPVVEDPAPGQECDVLLENLVTGDRTVIFEDRGAMAQGCRLDVGALIQAATKVEATLGEDTALVLLNKFGKIEVDGGGMCDLVASALERGIPVLIGVPLRHLPAWRNFAGEFAVELPDDLETINCWLARVTAPAGRMNAVA